MFYRARSAVVHYDNRKEKWKENPKEYYQYLAEQFKEGFDLARRTLFTLLREGRPRDWDKFVLSGGSQ